MTGAESSGGAGFVELSVAAVDGCDALGEVASGETAVGCAADGSVELGAVGVEFAGCAVAFASTGEADFCCAAGNLCEAAAGWSGAEA